MLPGLQLYCSIHTPYRQATGPFIATYALKADDDKAAVVRNGYLSERSIQTGLGDMAVKVPKVRDRSGSGIKFKLPGAALFEAHQEY